MEEDLDAAYQSYCQRQGHRAEKERQKRRRLGMDGELGSDEEEAAKAAAEYEPGSDAEEAEEVSCSTPQTCMGTWFTRLCMLSLQTTKKWAAMKKKLLWLLRNMILGVMLSHLAAG